jgi:peptidoglycan/LPS O-acetylase OafA/YrhL
MSNKLNQSQLTYRPEIDGLRAIAVLIVIFNHLGWSLFSGGYVGVDVFFVISGYLITSIISEEIKKGNFSLKNFYKRRVIRLAPAYFIVLAVTSVAALVFMLPAEIINYAQSVVYSTFFLANFFMWKEVGGYFATQSEYVPLLHLWSLAVEEQFYLFWPIALFLMYRLIRTRLLFLMIMGLIIAGVFISEYGVRQYPAAAYYLLPTRFFELMIGAAIAVIPKPSISSKTFRDLLVLIGLGLIGYTALTFTSERPFPGYWAIVPCVGAALVIVFSKENQGYVSQFLSSKTLVYIGLISYPAYLWHWPIIAFLNLNQIDINLVVGCLVLLATLLLSTLTHKYVERWFRKKMVNKKLTKVSLYGFISPAFCAVAFALLITNTSGLPSRFSDELNLKSTALLSYTHHARGRCNEGNVTNPLSADNCVLGQKDRPVDFLVIGDSHANHFTGMLDVMAKDAGVRGYDITQSQTVFLPGLERFYELDGKTVEHKNFKIRNIKLQEIIEKNQFQAVIISGAFFNYYNGGVFKSTQLQTINNVTVDDSLASPALFERGLRDAITVIIKSGSKPILIKDTPSLKGVVADCTLKNLRFELKYNCNFDVALYNSDVKKFDDLLSKLIIEFPELVVISPDKVACDRQLCFSEINGLPLYRDAGHLNQMGSELLGNLYIDRFGNPLSFLSNKSQSK